MSHPKTVGEETCSSIPEHEKERIRSRVEAFLRSFPMMRENGCFRSDVTRKERAQWRLDRIQEERLHLYFEEMLLLQARGRP